ncbi:hypothetical protein BJ165DRAFT_1511132 [Panaeolus papilionaceus]|nr:hypothetical protein BJ165DRAFT_1511132 [Panaeolus papilionaceus]
MLSLFNHYPLLTFTLSYIKQHTMTSDSKTRIFITGATGFLGGCVLDRILTHANVSNFDITVLVRTVENAKKLHGLGVRTVLGSYQDADLDFLTNAARESDIIITADGAAQELRLRATEALLQGLKERFKQTGKKSVFIHTSGAALVCDMTALGHRVPHSKTYSDLDVEALNSVPDSAIHRKIDKGIIAGDVEGYIKSYIIVPGYIFGHATGKVVDLGITNRFSIDVPFMITPPLKRKRGGFIGTGENVWPAVEVHEVADLFIVLLDVILDDTKADTAGHGREGYYFAEAFSFEHRSVSKAIAEALVNLGIAKETEANAFSEEELETLFGPGSPQFMGSHCLIKGERSRALGWKPTSSLKTLLDVEKKVTEETVKTLQRGELKA